MRIGVLAIQGDFAAHARMLRGLGAETVEVRTAEQLHEPVDGLVIPGGESTTIMKGLDGGLGDAISAHHAAGRPILGSCAGMIVCDRDHLGLADYRCRRNAFGRQLQSFETDLALDGIGDEPLRAVFIRAPWVEAQGAGVEILAEAEGHPVAVRDGGVIAVAFHPELTDDSRVHALFLAAVTTSTTASSSSTPGAAGVGRDPGGPDERGLR